MEAKSGQERAINEARSIVSESRKEIYSTASELREEIHSLQLIMDPAIFMEPAIIVDSKQEKGGYNLNESEYQAVLEIIDSIFDICERLEEISE